MFSDVVEEEQVIQRVAALDLGKAELVCCVRLPSTSGRSLAGGGPRVQEVTTHSTMTRSLTDLANRLVELRIERVVMEATSDYWKPVFYMLEAHGLNPWLVNARDVKHVPGRAKSDVLDAVWLCKLAERQMLRPSFVPPADIRRLRDLTRYRSALVAARTAEKNRVEKLLEDACIKLSVVASDIFGVSGRAMMSALIEGERDPARMAEMALGRMRPKITVLREALTGFFTEHHGLLLGQMLRRIDGLEDDIELLDQRIEASLVPFVDAVAHLEEIPGVGRVTAATIIAEIGTDMSRFPTAQHLCSWARFAPQTKMSAHKNKGRGSTGRGNLYLASKLGEAAVTAGRSDSFLGERYRRIARRGGKKRAQVATGRSMLVIIWHLLSDPQARYRDLGSDYHSRKINTAAKAHGHVRQLESLGYRVVIEPRNPAA